MKAKLALFLVILTLGFSPFKLYAHHNFLAEFDPEQPVEVTGTVVRVSLTNPHARLYVEASDENGETVIWDFELAAVSMLMRRGWRMDSIEAGDQVTVHADRARNASNVANARFVSLLNAEGEEEFRFGSPRD